LLGQASPMPWVKGLNVTFFSVAVATSMSKTYDDIITNKMLKYDDTHTGCKYVTSQKRA